MVQSSLSNNWQQAQKIHIHLFDMFKALFIETNPIPVKTCLYLMKMIDLELRLPLTPPSEENKNKLEGILKKYCLI
jgi:4-hydroxy-tetrahydrodipicolinate synthase